MKLTKVHLREKKISKGRKSLYLDFYPPIPHPISGKPTRREFLSLYVFEKPTTESQRNQKKETLMLAETIRSKRLLDIQLENYGFLGNKHENTDFLNYFERLARKRQDSDGNYGNWMSTYRYLKEYSKGTLTVGQVDEAFVKGFRDYLLKAPSNKSKKRKLSANSAYSYFNKLKAALKEAYNDRLFVENPGARVKGIKPTDTQREYLTLEELKLLVQTECDLPTLKRMALFSALTGLRWSDIEKLTWREVKYSVSQGYYLRFTQKKTKDSETLPISNQAYKYLGEEGDSDARVFPDMKYSAWTNLKLKEWIMEAGIRKKITFHCFRHTFATLQLSYGTDIYTVSKLLGHKEIRTTQVYARIIDEKKKDAVDRIPDLNL